MMAKQVATLSVGIPWYSRQPNQWIVGVAIFRSQKRLSNGGRLRLCQVTISCDLVNHSQAKKVYCLLEVMGWIKPLHIHQEEHFVATSKYQPCMQCAQIYDHCWFLGGFLRSHILVTCHHMFAIKTKFTGTCCGSTGTPKVPFPSMILHCTKDLLQWYWWLLLEMSAKKACLPNFANVGG